MVNQGNGKFIAKDKMMATYLTGVMNLSRHFSKFELSQILRKENGYDDTLSKLTVNQKRKRACGYNEKSHGYKISYPP